MREGLEGRCGQGPGIPGGVLIPGMSSLRAGPGEEGKLAASTRPGRGVGGRHASRGRWGGRGFSVAPGQRLQPRSLLQFPSHSLKK